MSLIGVLVIVAAASYTYGHKDDIDRELLKNDYVFRAQTNSGHRLAGWQVLAPKNVRCDMVRPKIKTFGYCWNDEENEKRGINTSKERGWVREVIQQWEKCGGMKFVEEPKCRVGPDFVTINVGDYHPMVSPNIDASQCKIYGFNMYLGFYTFGVNVESYGKTEKKRKAIIQMYALHEFGHFLGFDHEHNRKDMKGDKCTPDESVIGPNAPYGTSNISKEYDLDSIMNYCRPNVHYKPWLSDIDKKAVAIAYGGGNQKECDAVTKHWTWSKGEGLDDTTVMSLHIEETMGLNACADLMENNGCMNLIQSCKDEAMKFYCPKTCKYCK